jgi:hypothetical protein
MSSDEIIRGWKQGVTGGDHAPADTPAGGPAPNPAGEIEDDDLESVAGGSMGTESAGSIGCCTSIFCPQALA